MDRKERELEQPSLHNQQREQRSTHLPQLRQMNLQRLHVILKSQRDHSIKDILSSNCLPLLQLTFLRRLGGDEADELRDAFLDCLLRVFRDFGGRWDRIFHYARDIGYLTYHIVHIIRTKHEMESKVVEQRRVEIE